MKLAEALIERADLQRTISQVEERMKDNAKVQEGDEPTESIEALLPLYDELMARLEALIVSINKTNAVTTFGEITLANAITRRDCIKAKLGAYQRLYDAGSIGHDRFSRNEIRFVRKVDLGQVQELKDRLSMRYRQLDTQIQGLNWTIDLVE